MLGLHVLHSDALDYATPPSSLLSTCTQLAWFALLGSGNLIADAADAAAPAVSLIMPQRLQPFLFRSKRKAYWD